MKIWTFDDLQFNRHFSWKEIDFFRSKSNWENQINGQTQKSDVSFNHFISLRTNPVLIQFHDCGFSLFEKHDKLDCEWKIGKFGKKWKPNVYVRGWFPDVTQLCHDVMLNTEVVTFKFADWLGSSVPRYSWKICSVILDLEYWIRSWKVHFWLEIGILDQFCQIQQIRK